MSDQAEENDSTAGTNVLGPLHQNSAASCHLLTLYPFLVHNESDPIISGYESAFATYLAVQHLNSADGSVIQELESLESCPIDFSVEFLNTHYNAGLALQNLVERTINSNSTQQPCAFLGAYRSSISGPTSTITSLQGYPQLSGMSTSTNLDETLEHPLFGRTIPSDAGTASVVAQYVLEELQIGHLAVLATNDSFGNAYASQLRQALMTASPTFKMQQIPMEPDGSNIGDVIQQLSDLDYRYIFVAHFGGSNMSLNDALMREAHENDLTRSSSWIFSDGIASSLASKRFQPGDVLLEAYRGVGSIEASGGGIGNTADQQQYNVFARQLLTLKQSFLQYEGAHPLAQILPYYNEPQHAAALSFLTDDSFLNPLSDGRVPFIYEATVMLGLAACRAATEQTDGSMYLNGERFYDEITTTSFQGMSGYVQLDRSTGTRIANSTLFRLINFVEEENDNNGTVRLNPVNSNLFADGQWETLEPYIYNDGTTQQPLDIPALELESNHISVFVRAMALIFCSVAIVVALGCMGWTFYKRNVRVVRASQPMFLYLVCVGTIIFASTIIPMSFDGGNAKSLNGLDIACTSSVWLLSIGVGTIFSALFAKAHRINRIMQSSRRFRRIKVSIRDTLIPILALLFLNLLILSLMTGLDPITYEIEVVSYDSFDRVAETYGGCGYWSGSLQYTIPLLVLNLGMLAAAAFQSWRSRNLSTEFQESLSIFRALTGILLVVFVGCPVLVIAQDNTDAFLFISSAIIFISCLLILFLIFIPKLQYEKNRSMRGGITRISGLEISPSTAAFSSFVSSGMTSFGSQAEDDESDTGERIYSNKAHNELVAETATLRKAVKVLRANNRQLKIQARQNTDGGSSGDDDTVDEAAILLAAGGINIRNDSDDELSTDDMSNVRSVRFSLPDGANISSMSLPDVTKDPPNNDKIDAVQDALTAAAAAASDSNSIDNDDQDKSKQKVVKDALNEAVRLSTETAATEDLETAPLSS